MSDRQLALLLDDGVVIHDPSWRCVADVLFGFHGFREGRAVGVIVDAETLERVYPLPAQPPDPEGVGRTSRVLG